MSDESDAQEFLAEADKFKDKPKKARPSNNMTAKDEEPSENMIGSDDDEPLGKLVQYAYNGEGFSPTSSTIKRLPPGVYSTETVNHRLTFVPRKVNTDKLIRLPDSKSDAVIKRIKNFWELEPEYRLGNDDIQGGYLHKMGIMLFGPPGSGKTCTVKFIMQDIIARGGIVLLADGHPGTLSEGLTSFRQIEPEKPVVVVFEDFDELIQKYSEAQYLSILDGEASINRALFIATTNYPSRFDPRMYNRPGRFCDVIKIGMPSPEARRVYLDYQLKNKGIIDDIVKKTEGFSMDHLKALIQGVFLEKNDLDTEIKRLRTLFRPPKDDQGNATQNSMGIAADHKD